MRSAKLVRRPQRRPLAKTCTDRSGAAERAAVVRGTDLGGVESWRVQTPASQPLEPNRLLDCSLRPAVSSAINFIPFNIRHTLSYLLLPFHTRAYLFILIEKYEKYGAAWVSMGKFEKCGK